MPDHFKHLGKKPVVYTSHRGRELVSTKDIRRRLQAERQAPAAPPAVAVADLDGDIDNTVPGSPHDGPGSADNEADDAPAFGEVTDDEEEGAPGPVGSSPWERARPQLQQGFLEQLLPNQLLHQQLCSAELEVYQQCNARMHCNCPGCSSFTPHRSVLSSSLERRDEGLCRAVQHMRYTVHLCTQLAIHRLDVWPVQCAQCQHVHRVGPLQLGCLAGTANAFSLQQTGVPLIWFSMDLLQHLDRAIFVEGDQSIYKYVETRQAGWLCSMQVMGLRPSDDGLPSLAELPDSYKQQRLPVTADALRRQLGDAAREYGRARTMLETLPEQLPGWPLESGVPCAACLPNEAHLSYDMCFKLEQLGRKGFNLGAAGAVDQRRIISHAATIDSLAQIDSIMQQQSRLEPAAAAALTQIPARVPDLRSTADTACEQGGVQGPGSRSGGSAARCLGGGGGDFSGNPSNSSQAGPAEDAAMAAPAGGDTAASAEGPCGGTCSRFAADTLEASAPKGRLVTALAVAACRHGFVWSAINCLDAGERHAYAIMAFYLVLMTGYMMGAFWYDINCRWMPSLLRWLQQQDDEVKRKAANTWLPLPPWHLLAHVVPCRIRFGHIHMDGAGAGTGEVCERVNAWLGRHGKITRYMRPEHRQARLERVILMMERALDAKLPATLVALLLRARRGITTTTAEVTKAYAGLLQMLGPLYDQAVLDDRAKVHVAEAGARMLHPTARVSMDWRGEYVKAFLTVQAGSNSSSSGGQAGSSTAAPAVAAPLSMLFSKQAASSFKVTKTAVDAAQKTLGRLGAEHFPAGDPPTLADDHIKEGLQQWVAVTICNALEELLSLLSHARYAEWVVQQLIGQPGAVRRALKRKQAAWRQAKAVHEQLLEWARWAVRLQQQDVVQQWPTAFEQQLQDLLHTPLAELSGTSGGAGVVAGGSAADKAALEVYLLRRQLQAYNKEVAFVIEERGRLVSVLNSRHHALRSGLGDSQLGGNGLGGLPQPPQEAHSDAGDGVGSEAGSSSSGQSLGRRLVFLLELHRTEATLQVARSVATAGMTSAQEMEQLAAAVEVVADDE